MHGTRTAAWILTLALMASTAAAAPAPSAGKPPRLASETTLLYGGNPGMEAAVARDTVVLIGPWGSGALYNGQFEDPDGNPAWNGWTSIDYTQRTESRWHVDTYNVVAGSYSAWCGEIDIRSCGEDDPPGGYCNGYDEWLSWACTVGNPQAATTVHLTATVNHDTEPAYDYSQLGYRKKDSDLAYLWSVDGVGEQVPVDVSVTYLPGEYVGDEGDEVRLTWRVTSDSGWSDCDCSYYGAGALQIDDITVTVDNGGEITTVYEDFETCGPLGTLGDHWFLDFPLGVGDYAHVRGGLDDVDRCDQNVSPQACFIADWTMLEERGLPVQLCRTWCYGPGGCIVTTTGGQAGEDHHIYNAIRSPAIPWPVGEYPGVSFLFDGYLHEDLSADAPGTFCTWGIRSTDSTDPADLEGAAFLDRGFVNNGFGYDRRGLPSAADLLVQGRRFVQVEMAVYEVGYIWGWDGDDGYPAPYFDNVRLIAYSFYGPAITAREYMLAQDAFPADGQIHTGADLGRNDVRFDMAQDISLYSDPRNDPGDSMVVYIDAVRTGSEIVLTDDGVHGPPTLHFTILLNPVFPADVRRGAGPFVVNAGTTGELRGEILDDGAVSGRLVGRVTGAQVIDDYGVRESSWKFDLPDEDLLYPGDVLHWYIEAWDEVDGDFQNAFLPHDRSGYGNFDDPLAYPPACVVHALPTLLDADGAQPEILFWEDAGNRGGRDEWYGALRNLGLVAGDDYDIYYTNTVTQEAGLGTRATPGQVDGYPTLLYTCGDVEGFAGTYGYSEEEPVENLELLVDWLADGDRHLLLTGNQLVGNLWYRRDGVFQAFVSDWMGLSWYDNDVVALLGGELAPEVRAVPGNPVFVTAENWLAHSGCNLDVSLGPGYTWSRPAIHYFDAVEATEAEALAVFGDGASGFAAAARFVADNGSTVITLPYDLMYIYEPYATAKAGQPAPLPVRAWVLHDILTSFGHPATGGASGLDMPAPAFFATAFPNPFNPAVKISYRMPAAGRLTLKIFDVRGRQVRTLVDGPRPAGEGFVRWDGRADDGGEAASGVYFYEARSEEGTRIGKIALIR